MVAPGAALAVRFCTITAQAQHDALGTHAQRTLYDQVLTGWPQGEGGYGDTAVKIEQAAHDFKIVGCFLFWLRQVAAGGTEQAAGS